MMKWHAMAADDVAAAIDVDIERGLSSTQAAERLRKHGPNALREVPGTHWLRVFARQFAHVLIVILVIAAAVSLAIGETTDAVTIAVIVVVNAILGFGQEWRAEREIEALRRLLSPRCTVVRDGVETEIDASTVVPGDIVELVAGDRVPADVRILNDVALSIDESPLTGESLAVAKSSAAVDADADLADRIGMAWMGTTAVAGHARAIVIATGAETEFGRIAELTQTVEAEVTPLQKRLSDLGWRLGLIALVVSALVAAVGLLAGRPAYAMILTAVSLAVAVIPEGLPAVVTITLALGIRSMVRRRALLRRLPAAETLGSASVICTDKTGTLTQNQMVVQELWTARGPVHVSGGGYRPFGDLTRDGSPAPLAELVSIVRTGAVCNRARLNQIDGEWVPHGAPTEAALLALAGKVGIDIDHRPAPIAELPFDSTRKRMTAIERDGDELIAHIKGAPEVILGRSTHILDGDQRRTMTDADRATAIAAYEGFAAEGMRTLALARRALPADVSIADDAVERDLTLLGIVGIVDPPRPEVADAIAVANRAGIRVIMITGDAAATALAIARRIGLPAQRAVTGHELVDMDDDALRLALADEVVFARTAPEHKLRIVEQLQQLGHVTAMTGDGVNDSPALRRAEIGIAMGKRGTDVAKNASEMVLTDDNFASIVSAVEEGRRQYDNIKKFVRYMLASNTGEVMAILLSVIVGGPLILLPVQILWINLVTDGLNAVALGLEPVEPGAMDRKPRPPHEPIISWSGVASSSVLGLYLGAATLVLFLNRIGDGTGESLTYARNVAFTGIIVFELANVFNFRSLHAPLRNTGLLTNRYLLGAIGLMLALQLGAMYTPFTQSALHAAPIAAMDWLLIGLLSLPLLAVPELIKLSRWRARNARATAEAS
jgi:Ca2+-transporting ATPase